MIIVLFDETVWRGPMIESSSLFFFSLVTLPEADKYKILILCTKLESIFNKENFQQIVPQTQLQCDILKRLQIHQITNKT